MQGPESWIRVVIVGAMVTALLLWSLSDTGFRAERRLWIAGVVLGLVVTGGWIVTGIVGADEFEPTPLASLTFVRPVSDGILYLMTFTGSTLGFGVAVVAGVAAGAFAAGASTRTLGLRGFEDLYEMSRYLIGGVLMGVGGVLALGCTVGQGITGVSTLSVGSIVALMSIMAGGVVGARFLEQGSLVGAIRAIVSRA